MQRYLRPSSLQSALTALHQHVGQTPMVPLAGGTDYYPARTGPTADEVVLDVGALPGLREIEAHKDHWWIPCLTTWTDIIETPLPPLFNALKQAARQVGGRQIQNTGTLAGNVCNASPAADGIPCLLAMDAHVVLASIESTRTLPLQDFLASARKTNRQPNELLVGIRIPRHQETTQSVFLKLGARRYLVISITMVAAVITRSSDQRILQARIAVGSCAATAQRLPALEAAVIGITGQLPTILDQHLAPLSPIDDMRSTAVYRRHAVGTLLRRALVSDRTEAEDTRRMRVRA